jgi:biotin-dependent carboxylase-like uncharacterized protein
VSTVEAIEVLDGGFLTTVQDLGRYGYQRYGVPVSGAMDLFALRAANLLAGNPESAAALEVTLVGPRLRFLTDVVVAIAGADLGPRLDDRPVRPWRPFAAPAGAVLTFGDARHGLRAYIALAGGIDVPLVLGSRSTFTRGGLGGFEGRAIRSGDRISLAAIGNEAVEARTIAAEDIAIYGHEHSIRVVLGPQSDAFTAEGIATFLSAPYVISPKSDRIGIRLEGAAVRHIRSADIVSDGNPFGAIQVAGDGLPMVLVADRGTTGGYTKIATVISADLPRLAQALPGDRVFFREVSLTDALGAIRQQETVLERIARSEAIVFTRKRLNVTVAGSTYDVSVGLVERGRVAPVDTHDGVTEVRSEGHVSTMRYDIREAGGSQ